MSESAPSDCGCTEYAQLARRAWLGAAWRWGAAAVVSAPAWLPKLAFAAEGAVNRDLVVCIFLRGGADGLTLCVPHGDDGYYRARRATAVARPDSTNPLRAIDLDGFFGLPPAMAALKPIYEAGQLAVVHATGLTDSTRSHFEAQDRMEAATPGAPPSISGWLARHLLAVEAPQDGRLRAVAAGGAIPRSLATAPAAIALPDIESYGLAGRPQTNEERTALLRARYEQTAEPLRTHAANVFASIELIRQIGAASQSPAESGYPDTAFGKGLHAVAALAKADVGLEVACVDLGGWDTHAAQGSTSGQLHAQMQQLAAGLAAFHADMAPRADRYTVLVMSEFGRRVAENYSLGTDHGHGNAMFVMGGNVNGGRVITSWPGLDPEQLDDGRDLSISIDYRDICAEVLADRAGNPDLDVVFPGYVPNFRDVTR